MKLLEGKNALISGILNKKSIAWGIARALHLHGAKLSFTCLESNLRRVKKLASKLDTNIIIPCDVRNESDIKKALDSVSETFKGKLDIFVHSIGFANFDDLGGEFINTSRSGWNIAMEVSAYSLVCFARYCRPLMDQAGGGSIITITFCGGEVVVPGYNVMGIAKAALAMSVKYLAYDLGPEQIRVNAISPGPIPTISSQVLEDFNYGLTLFQERSPLMKNVIIEDVGNTAVYLASDLSSTVTGTIMRIDSGMHIMCPPTAPRKKNRY